MTSALNPAPDQTDPHDIHAEETLLGMCLISKHAVEAVAEHGLDPEDFYRPAHQMIYEAARHLADTGQPVSVPAVNAELVRRGHSIQTGGAPKLVDLSSDVLPPSSAPYYARQIIDQSRLRRALQGARRAAQIAFEGRGDVDELIELIDAEMQAATAPRGTDVDGFVDLGDVLPDVIDDLQNAPEEGDRVELPYKDLDALTSGIEPGEVFVVAGRPGMGKTTLGLDAARHIAIRNGQPVAFFSLEMSRKELATRMLCAESRVPLHTMKERLMTEDDWARMADARARMAAAPLKIDDSPNTTTAHIRARLRGMQRAGAPAQLVVVDYLQLMKAPGRSDNRQQEVSDISRELKLIAKEFEVGVIVAAQLNRGPEQRTDKRPMVSDLRESGSVEQDADVVILLYREDVYDKDSPLAGIQELIIGKHRAGPTTTVEVGFHGHLCRAVDLAA